MNANSESTCISGNPWLARSARIEKVIDETPGVATYELALDKPDLVYSCMPGQFNMIYLPGIGEAAISVSGRTSYAAVIAHTIRQAGSVTHALADLKEGSHIGLRGPFGTGWPVDLARGNNLILVAGGIGLAPLRPVIYSILEERDAFGQVTVLCGSRHPSGLLYTDEYTTWSENGIDVKTIVDRGDDNWGGNIGVVTTLIDRLTINRPQRTLLMTCGPEIMMWYTVQTALSRGLRPESMYVSLERNMNCAIGLCGHCQFGAEFICKDGPVFRYDRVAPILRIDDL